MKNLETASFFVTIVKNFTIQVDFLFRVVTLKLSNFSESSKRLII